MATRELDHYRRLLNSKKPEQTVARPWIAVLKANVCAKRVVA